MVSMGVDFCSTLGGPLIKAPRSNTEDVRIETHCAEEGWGVGSAPSPENFSIADLKMVSFDAFCVVF